METMLSLTGCHDCERHDIFSPRLIEKLPNDVTLFMDGTGNWTAPAGSGGDSLWSVSEVGVYIQRRPCWDWCGRQSSCIGWER